MKKRLIIKVFGKAGSKYESFFLKNVKIYYNDAKKLAKRKWKGYFQELSKNTNSGYHPRSASSKKNIRLFFDEAQIYIPKK